MEGIVFTMYDSRTNLSMQVVENVKSHLNQNIYNTLIPIVFSKLFLSTPNPLVVFPCGSVSITSTFLFFAAKAADKLIEVVVFPTPPYIIKL